MAKQSSVGRRISSAIEHFQNSELEESLIHVFPALDKTAKKRRGKDGVGKRIKSLLKDQEYIITTIGIGVAIINCRFDGRTLEEVIYKFGRTAIAHEGELDKRLRIVDSGNISFGSSVWVFPKNYIVGLILAIISAKENSSEILTQDKELVFFGKTYRLNSLWGKEDDLKELFMKRFLSPPTPPSSSGTPRPPA